MVPADAVLNVSLAGLVAGIRDGSVPEEELDSVCGVLQEGAGEGSEEFRVLAMQGELRGLSSFDRARRELVAVLLEKTPLSHPGLSRWLQPADFLKTGPLAKEVYEVLEGLHNGTVSPLLSEAVFAFLQEKKIIEVLSPEEYRRIGQEISRLPSVEDDYKGVEKELRSVDQTIVLLTK